MKLTTKKVKKEVEATETVCEITQEEFHKVCADVAASTVCKYLKGTIAVDILDALAMTSLIAQFVSNLDDRLFYETDTNTKTNKKETN